MKKRILALALVLCMLIPLAVSCGGDEVETTTTAPSTSDTTASTTAVSETEAPIVTSKYEIGDNLPADLNYGGKEVHFLSRGRSWCVDVVDVEALTGEVINDAVYNRNATVEDRLGIKIVDHKNNDSDDYAITNLLRVQIPAGDSDYQVICGATYALLDGVTDNLYQNLLEVENIDLSRPYWSQGINEAMHVGQGQYLVTGAISMAYYRFIFATFFNKDLFDENNIPYLYETVESGKWTIDYQKQIAEVFYSDLNGSNTPDEADRYGFLTSPDGINSDVFWSAFELPILTKDQDNFLAFSANKDRLMTAVEKVNAMVWNDTSTFRYVKETSDVEQSKLIKMFTEDRAAMTPLRLIEVETQEMRDMESKYGIVPIPKLDEAQTEYHSHIHDNTDAFAIPLTTVGEELEMVGALLEAMASEGYRTLEPAYYEVALKTKYVSDENSVKMLDLVINGLHVDPGFLFVDGTAGFHQNMRTWIGKNSKNVASAMAANDRIIGKQIQKLNDNIAAIQ